MNADPLPTPERRPSLAPYVLRPSPELLRLSDLAFRWVEILKEYAQ